MKVIIAGGRNYTNYDTVLNAIRYSGFDISNKSIFTCEEWLFSPFSGVAVKIDY